MATYAWGKGLTTVLTGCGVFVLFSRELLLTAYPGTGGGTTFACSSGLIVGLAGGGGSALKSGFLKGLAGTGGNPPCNNGFI